MYAGGIQLDADCNYCTITNCHIRGSGDDGIAIASDTNRSNPSNNNTAIYNTVVANWNAANFDLAGGTGNIIEYNYFADSGTDASFVINLPGAYPMYAVTGATITNNTIVRGGGDVGGQYRAAVWIFPQYAAVSGVTFSNNYILNSIWRGIEFEASGTMCSATTMTFNSNIINGIVNSTGDGIDITSGFSGNGTFTNNTVTVPTTAYKNSAPTTFTGSGSGNTPAFTFP
jgi:hypothetical protein